MCRSKIFPFFHAASLKATIRCTIIGILALLQPVLPLAGQENVLEVMTWNLLNFPDHSQDRIADIGRVLGEIEPDILVLNEMKSGSISLLYNQALQPLACTYASGPFVAKDLLNNAIFYCSERLTLLGSVTIATALRDINGYTFRIEDHADTAFTFTIFAAHLKAGNPYFDPAASTKRLEECKRLKAYIANQDSNYHYAFAGDFNFYDAAEAGYSLLMDSMAVDLEDPIDTPGEWHDGYAYRHIHTQSTRTTNLGDGGATGGMDDRFDFILLSHHMFEDSAALSYVTGSYEAYGNDGQHYGNAINVSDNGVVPPEIADALYTASDHLPVILQLSYPADPTHVVKDLGGHGIPAEYRLFPAYPNPFNPVTRISFALPVRSMVSLRLYDLLGREVAQLAGGIYGVGIHQVVWDGRSAVGHELPSGIYVARLMAPGYTQSIRLLLLK